MACECKDENGSLLDKCLGSCISGRMIGAIDFEDKMAEFERLISQAVCKIDESLSGSSFIMEDLYKEGFADGFKKGFESGRDY